MCQRKRAVFDRSWSYLSGIAAVAVVPLAAMYATAQPGTINHGHMLRLAEQPLRVGVRIATVTRPLDLKALTNADFGDGEHIR